MLKKLRNGKIIYLEKYIFQKLYEFLKHEFWKKFRIQKKIKNLKKMWIWKNYEYNEKIINFEKIIN